MQLLIESLLLGNWRSYKAFLQSGNVKLYNLRSFLEFDFTEEKQLTITQHDETRIRRIIQTANWFIDFNNKKHYLLINGNSPSYEVITVNHTALVLMNEATNEKTFFARQPHWEAILSNNTVLTL